MRLEENASIDSAIEALQEADDDLAVLPLTKDVRDLHEQSAALHTVLHRATHGYGPELDREQEARLVERVLSLAREASELRRHGEPPQTRRNSAHAEPPPSSSTPG